ncbi:MAG: ABC transporter permease, partial [Vulcanimicrobiaceae bacterium]
MSRRSPVAALFGALVLGHIRANRLRSAVTIVAVALGVAIALAIDLANETAIASFATSVNVIANHVNLQVLGVGRGFDERALLRVMRVSGVRAADPAIEDAMVVGARAGEPFSGEILRVIGVDLLRPLPRGRPQGASIDPFELVAGRGAIVSSRIAGRYHLRVGSRLDALAGDRVIALRVAGILPADSVGVDS